MAELQGALVNDARFDLIISGTGLVESIVACAAARAGLKVLHLDDSDHYGKDYSSQSLACFSKQQQTSSKLSIVIESSCNDSFQEILRLSRGYSIDTTPQLIMASGLGVDNLLASDVSKYLEFRSIDGIFFLSGSEKISRVPCSKGDVFSSKMLSAIEKRYLTKFLMFAADYGRIANGAELDCVNERDIGLGMALRRPQNSTSSNLRDTRSSSEYSLTGLEDAPFGDYLSSRCRLSPRLQSVIVHALCLVIRSSSSEGAGETDAWTKGGHGKQNHLLMRNLSAVEGVARLALHMNSLSRYGQTALLYPMYGCSELAQGFCRMCAVWGGSYRLRSKAVRIELETDAGTNAQRTIHVDVQEQEMDGPSDTEPAANDAGDSAVKKTERFICGAYLSCAEDWLASEIVNTDSPSVRGAATVPSLTVRSVLVTRTSLRRRPYTALQVVSSTSTEGVTNGTDSEESEADSEAPPNALLVIAPHTAGIANPHAVLVTQISSSAMVCPQGTSEVVVHMVTQVDLPQSLSLTSVEQWREKAAELGEGIVSLMGRVAQTLDASSISTAVAAVEEDVEKVEDDMFVRLQVRPLIQVDTLNDSEECVNDNPPDINNKDGPTVLNTARSVAISADGPHFQITFDGAVTQAKHIFSRLFPGRQFMDLSPELQEAAGTAAASMADDDDDELRALEAILSMGDREGKNSSDSSHDDDMNDEKEVADSSADTNITSRSVRMPENKNQ